MHLTHSAALRQGRSSAFPLRGVRKKQMAEAGFSTSSRHLCFDPAIRRRGRLLRQAAYFCTAPVRAVQAAYQASNSFSWASA